MMIMTVNIVIIVDMVNLVMADSNAGGGNDNDEYNYKNGSDKFGSSRE